MFSDETLVWHWQSTKIIEHFIQLNTDKCEMGDKGRPLSRVVYSPVPLECVYCSNCTILIPQENYFVLWYKIRKGNTFRV